MWQIVAEHKLTKLLVLFEQTQTWRGKQKDEWWSKLSDETIASLFATAITVLFWTWYGGFSITAGGFVRYVLHHMDLTETWLSRL